MNPRITGFPPVAGEDARVLVLGTMPSPASLAAGFYYAHPQNQFWRIMEALVGVPAAAPFAVRAEGLKRARIALWDVCRTCIRPGSADAEIRAVEPNDFISFFARHPHIRAVFFNGTTAERLFRRHVWPHLPEKVRTLHFARLPSTSPAHATRSFEEKLAAWRVLLAWL